ncbi:MAG: TolC family protein [Prochlorothrix sp.]|nr:TolC family protein [Prochlorothrix sp.]
MSQAPQPERHPLENRVDPEAARNPADNLTENVTEDIAENVTEDIAIVAEPGVQESETSEIATEAAEIVASEGEPAGTAVAERQRGQIDRPELDRSPIEPVTLQPIIIKPLAVEPLPPDLLEAELQPNTTAASEFAPEVSRDIAPAINPEIASESETVETVTDTIAALGTESAINSVTDSAAEETVLQTVAQDSVVEDQGSEDRVAEDRVTQDPAAEDLAATDQVAADQVAADQVAEDQVAADSVTQNWVAQDSAIETLMVEGVDLNAPHLRPLLTDSNPLELPFDPAQVTIADTLALTLAEVTALALHNNRTLQAQEVALLQRREALRQQQAQRYPSVTFDSNIQRTGADTTVLSTNAPPFSAPTDSSQGTTTLNGTVRVDYNIYDPDRRPSIQAAEGEVRQAELLVEQTRQQVRLDAASDYYQLQNSDEQVRIADGAVTAAEKSLKDAQQLERAGVGTRFAVLQAEVQLANEQQNLANAKANQVKAQRQLAQRLSLPATVNLIAADTVAPAGEWPIALADSIILAFANRSELEQNLIQREVSTAQREVALASIRPNLGFFGQYSLDTNLSGTSSQGTTTTQDTFSRQYAVGVNLNWRLFDGGAARASARQQELGRETAELEFADNRNQIRQQVEDAYYDLQANQQNIGTANLGVGQAKDALCLARLRFQAGVGTQIDVINAERDLTRAAGNLATAIVNYNLALAQMQRATSDFSRDLPASPTLAPYQSTIQTRNCE